MNTTKCKARSGIWYEDKDGNYLGTEPIEGAYTYHVCFPLEVTEHVYIYHNEKEKRTCKHKRRCLQKDRDIIKGYKGRTCISCGCSQVRKWWQPWGRRWDEGTNTTPLIDFNTHIGSGNDDVILAMVSSGDYRLSEALAVWASACERCMNALAWKYTNGQDGYEEFSEQWEKAGTCCDLCK